MPTTRRKTDEVLASARRELQAQLALVREELSQLAGEESALTKTLSSIDGDGAAARAQVARAGKPSATASTAKGSTRRRASSTGGRRPRARAKSKSTADRVEELEGLLASGPKSRNDLAAELQVSPARVQQLLAELGSAVSATPHPELRGGKLWSLKGSGDGKGAAKPAAERRSD